MSLKKPSNQKRLIPVGAQERVIEFDSGSVRILVGGEKNKSIPILLIHGGGTDNASISWYKLFKPLSEKHKVLAIDLPGFGLTNNIEPLGSPSKTAEFVVQVMKKLSIEYVHICGVSMGGDIALNIALLRPSFLKSLILIAPGGLVPIVKNRFIHTFAWIGCQTPDFLLVPLAKMANKFVKSILKQIVYDIKTLPQEVIDEFYLEAQKPLAGIAYGRYNQATIGFREMKNNLLESVYKIDTPSLFFHGTRDTMVDINGSILAVERMPQACLVTLDYCGHWVQLEKPDIFFDKMICFLDEITNG